MQKNNLKFLIFESNEQSVGSWSHYYDSLKLFSPARLSSLPGLRIPGYRPNLSYLKSVGTLDLEGRALHTTGVSQTVPGLYYVGLEGQRSFASATLTGVGPDAKFVIRGLMRQLEQQ